MQDFEPFTGRQRYMLFILMLVYACHLIDRTMVLVLLDPIKHEYGLSDTQLGLFSGFMFAAGTVVAALPLGTLADRRPRKSILAVCIAIWSLMTLLCGAAWSYTSLLAMRFGVGAAEAGLQPTALSMIADEVRAEKRGKAIAIVHVGSALGTLIGFVAGGWIASHMGWRSALLIVGVPGLLLAVVVAVTLWEPTRQSAAETNAGHRGASAQALSTRDFFRTLWRDRALVHVVLGTVVLWLCTSSSSAWWASFLIRSHGVPIAVVGMIMAGTAGFGGILGNFIAGTLSERVAHGRPDRLALMSVAGGIIYFPLSLITLMAGNLTLVVACLFFQMMAYYIIFTPAYSLAMGLANSSIRGRTAALMSMGATAIGYGLGSQIVGVLSDLLRPDLGIESLRYALIIMMFTMLWAAAHFLAAWLKLRKRQRVATG
ncbi:MAG: MFS transporter [Sphingobium sp.]